MDPITMVDIGAPELVVHTLFFIAIPDHFQARLAQGNPVFSNRVSVLVFEVYAASFIEVDDRGNGLLLAELIDGHYIMCRIEQDFRHICFFEKCPHGMVSVAKAIRIMHGSPVQ